MNTPLLRFLRHFAASAPLAAALAGGAGCTAGVATGGAPPEVLRWHRYAEPVFPAPLMSTPVREGFANIVFTSMTTAVSRIAS